MSESEVTHENKIKSRNKVFTEIPPIRLALSLTIPHDLHAMNESSLDSRIRSVRKGVRSTQPLEHRIKVVRSHYTKRQSAPRREVHVQLAGRPQQ